MKIPYALFGRQIIRGYIFLGVFFIDSRRLSAKADQENGDTAYKNYEKQLGASRGVEDLVCKGLTVKAVQIKEEMHDHGSYAGSAGVHYRKKQKSRKEIDGEQRQPEMKHGKKG